MDDKLLAHFARLQERLARLLARVEREAQAEARWRPPDRFTFQQELQIVVLLAAAERS